LQIRNSIIGILLATVMFTSLPVFGGDSPAEINQRIGTGDPEVGKDLSAMCQGCHGEDGNSVVPTFPKLSGQWADYIQKQFREFQNGARTDPTMSDMALSVGEFPELFDIAAYFASQKLMEGPVTEDPSVLAPYRRGEKLFIEGNADSGAFRCIKCHGEHGMGTPLNNPLFPIIGGQHKDYLVKQLTDFKRSDRDNDRSGMMMLIAGRLSDSEIEDLAIYLANKEPVYKTVFEEKTLRIKGTNFKVGSAKLQKTARTQLNAIVEYANRVPDANFEIFGYTDSTGSLELNMKLSLVRAELVANYLINKGVAAERIITKGMGPENPIADNATESGRRENRRVELRSVHKESKKVRTN